MPTPVVSQLANSDGGVETLADQVDETIGIFGLQRHLQVGQHEIGHQPDLPGPWGLCLQVFKLHDIGSVGAVENDAGSHDRILLDGCSSQANQAGCR